MVLWLVLCTFNLKVGGLSQVSIIMFLLEKKLSFTLSLPTQVCKWVPVTIKKLKTLAIEG